MQNILLFYESDLALGCLAELEREGAVVTSRALNEGPPDANPEDFDAVILEAIGEPDETRRLVESQPRRPKVPLILLLRADQLDALDPAWPIDDFLVIPGPAGELAARLSHATWQRSGVDGTSMLKAGNLTLDLANYKVFVGDQPANLTFKEFELLRFLMTNRGKVFTREALLNRVWGYEYFGGARTVDVHIRRLRSKIESSKIETGSTVYVETVRNVGYRFPA